MEALINMGFYKILQRIIPEEIIFFIRHRLQGREYFRLFYEKNADNVYNEDRLVTWGRNLHFLQEAKFRESYDEAVRMNLYVSPNIQWRLHVLCWAGVVASKLEGDFVECGVNKGFSSKILMDYLEFEKLEKTFYLMDTFEGLVEALLTEEEKQIGITGGGYKPCIDVVKKVFGNKENFKIIKGIIPQTLPLVDTEKVSFLHIDLNCVFPETEALKYFWERMVKGSIVIFDDYGWSGSIEQKKAHDAFAESKGLKILTMPTGQGMLIKPF